MVQITPLFYVVPVLSRFSVTPPDSTPNGLAVRQVFDTNSLPSDCQSPCQVVNSMTDCSTDLSCMCTNTIGSQLEQCMSCIATSEPTVEDEAQSAITSWNDTCSGNLSLSGGSSSGATTGGTASETAGGTSSATTTNTSSSDSSSPIPLGVNGGAVSLKSCGSIAMYIVAVLAGAFMSL